MPENKPSLFFFDKQSMRDKKLLINLDRDKVTQRFTKTNYTIKTLKVVVCVVGLTNLYLLHIFVPPYTIFTLSWHFL